MSRSIDLSELSAALEGYRISGQGRIDLIDLADVLAELLSPEELWDLVRLLSQQAK